MSAPGSAVTRPTFWGIGHAGEAVFYYLAAVSIAIFLYGIYARVSVPAGGDGDEGRAAVYVGDPKRLDAAKPVEWPGEGSFVERVERYVRGDRVAVERLD